jgi:hypothetical protein
MRGESETHRRVLEELKELFGPAFGPAVEAYGRSLAERICQDDEGFVSGVREGFEEGREHGEFPALSELLGGASEREVEEFFESGWTDVALPPLASAPAATKTNPWDLAPWGGDMEAYREDLYAGMAFGFSDLRAFAREWLEELLRVGYYGMEESLGLPFKQQAGNLSAVPSPLPLFGEAYPVRIGDAGQVSWLQLDAGRSARGYKNVAISDEPLRTDKAIIAALTALEGRPMDAQRLARVLPEVVPAYGESVWDRWTRTLRERRSDEDLVEALEGLRYHQALDYVLTLLRYHRPGFDEMPREERVALVAGTCSYINAFLETLRKLVAFLEHGTPGRRIPAATKAAARDVGAAVLKDVDGLTYREIGHKGDHPTVRKMVRRGRRLLEQALGAEGWRVQAEAMRVEAERWSSLSEEEREAVLEAEALGVAFKEPFQREGSLRRQDETGIA